MRIKFLISLSIFVVVFLIDQYIKMIFVDGFQLPGECISLVLAYNKGVAFSMFAFLEHYLKYIQIAMIVGIVIYLSIYRELFSTYFVSIGLIIGAGVSNIYDRFHHIGVVDYIYWHCGFEFAIFNLADMLINLGIAIVLYQIYIQRDNKDENENRSKQKENR